MRFSTIDRKVHTCAFNPETLKQQFKCFAYSLSFNVKYGVEFVDPFREETAFKSDQEEKKKLSLSVVFCNSLESYLTDGPCVFLV